MQINNSVSMLTTQRAMSSAGKDMTEAMERLATGTKINNSADDPIGHSISQKMSAQIQSLNTAIKNANDGIALTRSIEGAIGTLTDMLQRMRELAMQSTNGTNSNIDRSFLQEEVELLQEEITRVSETTRYNGALILDGRFKNQSFMVGAESSDEIKFSVDSVASDMIGAHTYIGNGIEAMPSSTTGGDRNHITAMHDVEISGYSGTKLIKSDLADTAEIMAKKINLATGRTGVRADAKTIALMSFEPLAQAESLNGARFRVNVNGVSTGNFVFSEKSADEAVWAINQISGQTGVIATQSDHKVILTDPNGGDITIGNLSQSKGMSIHKVGDDGFSLIGGASALDVFGKNDSVRVSGTIKLSSSEKFTVLQKGDKAVSGVKVTLGRADSYAPGDYYLMNANGTRTEFTIVNSTASEFQAKIRAVTGEEGFQVVGVDGGFDNGLGFQITGPREYGDFDIYQADGTKINGGTSAAVKISYGMAKSYGAGDYYIVDSAGNRSDFTTTAATTSNFQAGIRAATGDNGFTVVEVDGGTNNKYDDEMKITGSLAYGDFDLFKADGTRITGNNNALIKMSLGTVNEYPAGGYYLAKDDGTQINFTTTASSAAEFQTKIRAATGDTKFNVFEANGSSNGNDEIIIRPPVSYGGFNIFKADGTQITQDKKVLEVTGVPEEIKGIAQPGYFAISNDLYVQRDTTASTMMGKLSLIGDILYEGDGTQAVVVGRIDSENNGLDGKSFKFNLGYEFENGDFEQGAIGDTSIPGWDIIKSQVRLNGVDSVVGHATPQDIVFPATVDNNQSAPYDSNVNAASYQGALDGETPPGSDKSVMLSSTSVNVPAFGILHGPYLASQTSVKLEEGDEIAFDWRALGGADAYDVMGYLVDEDTGHIEEILNETGADADAETLWSTETKKVSKDGQYKFVFIAGTWDASGGSAAGAKLYIDNVKVTTMPDLSMGAIQELGQRLVTTADGKPQEFEAVIPHAAAFEFRVDDSGKSTLYHVDDVDVSNAMDAGKSINIIDNALDKLSLMRSEMGAIEARLDQVISKQIGIKEQTTVSRSRLEDADYALEASRLSKNQVLQQAGSSVLVQANEITRMAIELLKR